MTEGSFLFQHVAPWERLFPSSGNSGAIFTLREPFMLPSGEESTTAVILTSMTAEDGVLTRSGEIYFLSSAVPPVACGWALSFFLTADESPRAFVVERPDYERHSVVEETVYPPDSPDTASRWVECNEVFRRLLCAVSAATDRSPVVGPDNPLWSYTRLWQS